MRILLVSEDIPYPSMGGLAKHVMTLARALVKAGHEVDLLGGDQHPIEVAGDEGRFGGRFFGELHGHLGGWKESQIGMFFPQKRPWIARKMAQSILSHAERYDVIHYHGHFPNIGKYIPKHINFVQTRHDQGSDCLRHTRFRDGEICDRLDPADCAGCIASKPNALQRALSAYSVRSYRRDVGEAFKRHKTIFVSEMLKRHFARMSGEYEWGAVVNHFVDLEKLRQALKIKASPINADNQNLKVFVAGKLYPPKGIEVLLQTLVPLLPEHMQLTIAGDGPDEARLRQQFESDRITFLGWCDSSAVLNHAAASDVILVPSVCEEAFGATILEGLLLGKPTFALARSVTPEMQGYQQYQGQLHLHPEMDSLVREVVSFQPQPHNNQISDGRGGVENIVQRLLEIYCAPAGANIS
ncbi:MAG: glycosyltransferase family 4 protein [Methylomonas sp.]